VRSSSSGWLLLIVLALAPGCGSSAPPAEQPVRRTKKAGPDREAIAVLDRLAGAMAKNRADRLIDVADPVHGLRFWGQPGMCAMPLFKVDDRDTGPLTELARGRMERAPPHFLKPDGYWREVAETIRAGLRVVKENAGRYELPPEEGLDRASPWASLDTRKVALGNRELSCLDDDDVGKAGKAPKSEYRFRFRAERGYSSVTVFLVEHDDELRVAHVILVWHYDA
jgi:hypothetical protein